jgi:quercetin dioxygenase-like cupin family protein
MNGSGEIEHWNETADGPLTGQNLSRKIAAQGYRCDTWRYPPGTYFPDHTHTVDKIDGVLSGRFRITMDGVSRVLEPGDCIAVPAGKVHSAEVVGAETVVSIDAVKIS